MATQPVSHVGPWTERDLLELPHDGQRHELVEGRLLVSPPPAGPHQLSTGNLYLRLRNAAPAELRVVEGLGVRVPGDEDSVLVPDIMVAEAAAVLRDRSGVLDRGVVLLVIEVVSPGSAIIDRVTKPIVYARGGIPSFWRVELGKDGPTISSFRLERSEYVSESTAGPGELLTVSRPFPITLDPADIAPSA